MGGIQDPARPRPPVVLPLAPERATLTEMLRLYADAFMQFSARLNDQDSTLSEYMAQVHLLTANSDRRFGHMSDRLDELAGDARRRSTDIQEMRKSIDTLAREVHQARQDSMNDVKELQTEIEEIKTNPGVETKTRSDRPLTERDLKLREAEELKARVAEQRKFWWAIVRGVLVAVVAAAILGGGGYFFGTRAGAQDHAAGAR